MAIAVAGPPKAVTLLRRRYGHLPLTRANPRRAPPARRPAPPGRRSTPRSTPKRATQKSKQETPRPLHPVSGPLSAVHSGQNRAPRGLPAERQTRWKGRISGNRSRYILVREKCVFRRVVRRLVSAQVADRRRRNALIVRLRREEGWPERQIALDPRVRLSHVHVMRALERHRERQQRGDNVRTDDLMLRLYRGGLVERDPAALELWELYVARACEHEAALADLRYGRQYSELPLTTCEGIRREALTLAALEVQELMGQRIKDIAAELPPIPHGRGTLTAAAAVTSR